MTNFEVIIGIEIHLELNTNTKMFSPAKNDFNSTPNTCINQIDMGYPGTLPLLNKEAVKSAIKLAKALNMTIDDELHFDRKNYFYTDLPKGFQITQFFRPIGSEGYLEVKANDEIKKIAIERIHLEEDTARQHHETDKTKLDYNRAGVPLIEIVSHPVIHTSEEAVAYVDMIRRIALSLGISDAKMDQGSLRADINVSLRPFGYKEFGTKVEIKNMNTFAGIKKALDYEIAWQTKQILTNKPILQQTKRYDEDKQETVTMRIKTGEIDYRYFPEPNIPFIKLSEKFINSIKLNELPWEREKRYKKEQILDVYINSLVNDLELAQYFDSIKYWDRNKLSKLFFAEIVSLANSQNKHPKDLNIKNEHLEKALTLLDDGIISGKSFKVLIPLLMDYQGNIEILIEERKLKQISDPTIINQWINEIIDKNQNLVGEYKNRPERVLKFILGSIMKVSKGQVSPTKANTILLEKLNKMFK